MYKQIETLSKIKGSKLQTPDLKAVGSNPAGRTIISNDFESVPCRLFSFVCPICIPEFPVPPWA